MGYRTITNLLDHKMNQPSKFRTRNWVGINYELWQDYNDDDENNNTVDNNNNNNMKFKKSMIRLRLCDYSDAYIRVKGILTVPNTEATGAAVNNTHKKVVFKNCDPFNGCTNLINNKLVNYAEEVNI